MTTISVSVPSSLDGVRVDRAVALLADVSRAAVDDLVAAGRVTLDGKVVTSRSTKLVEGQELAVDRPDEEEAIGPVGDPSVVFGVVHVDDDVVVVDKPAGLVVHPGAGHRSGTLVHGLVARFPDLADLPARWDRSRTGRASCTGSTGERPVSWSWPARPTPTVRWWRSCRPAKSSRTYRALVLGTVEGESGVVDAPIGRSVSTPTRMAVSRKGKEARTRYRVEERFALPAPTTLVRASLETGRTHQIRVHLSAIGHPVVGDEPYGQGRSLPGATVTAAVPPRLGAVLRSSAARANGCRGRRELPEDLATQLAALGQLNGPHRRGPARSPAGAVGPRAQAASCAASSTSLTASSLERLRLGLANLADADPQALRRGLERRRIAAVETEAVPDDLALEVREPVDGLADQVEGELHGDLVLEVALVAGHQVTQGGGGVGGGRLVEAGHDPGGSGQVRPDRGGGVGGIVELVVGRRPLQLMGELPQGRVDLLVPLGDLHGEADGAPVLLDGPLEGLSDPPRGVGGEPEAALPVELVRPPASGRTCPPG